MFYFINNISYNYSEGVLTKKEQEIKLTNKQKKLLNYFVTTHTHRHCREGGNLINISVKGSN